MPAPQLAHALALAAEGFRVFPLRDPGPEGKLPRIKGWQAAATADPAQIEAWWNAWPNANIGIATGGAIGLVAVDLDGDKGVASWAELVRPHGDPETRTSRSGSGKGYHLLFKATPEQLSAIGNIRGVLPNVDIRAEGGLIAAPGSVHANGQQYAWFGPCRTIAPLPSWLFEIIKRPPAPDLDAAQPPARDDTPLSDRFGRAVAAVAHLPPSVAGQGGDDALYAAACTIFRGFQLTPELALAALRYYNATRAEPAWSEERLRHKIEQAAVSSTSPWGFMLDEFVPSRSGGSPGPLAGAGTNSPQTLAITWIHGAEAAEPLPPVKWRVQGLQIAHGRPTLLTAYGFAGKTISAQAMLLAFAAGLPVWGNFVTDGGTMRHLDYEQGRAATLLRYQRLATGLGIGLGALEQRFGVACFPELYLSAQGARDTYAKVCEGADLVLVDALRGTTPGVDENDSRIRTCIDALSWASERTGTAFVLIHHGGKGEGELAAARGSSAIFDGCGAVYTMAGECDAPKRVQMLKSPAIAAGGVVESFELEIKDVDLDGLRVEWRAPARAAEPNEGDSIEQVQAHILALVRERPDFHSLAGIEQALRAGGVKFTDKISSKAFRLACAEKRLFKDDVSGRWHVRAHD